MELYQPIIQTAVTTDLEWTDWGALQILVTLRAVVPSAQSTPRDSPTQNMRSERMNISLDCLDKRSGAAVLNGFSARGAKFKSKGSIWRVISGFWVQLQGGYQIQLPKSDVRHRSRAVLFTILTAGLVVTKRGTWSRSCPFFGAHLECTRPARRVYTEKY